MNVKARQIVVGITGASGAAYAQRFIQLAVAAGAHVHLVVSPLGQRLLHDELGMEGIDVEALAGRAKPQAGAGAVGASEASSGGEVRAANGVAGGGVTLHNYRDVGASIASGSFRHDGMCIIPCSSNTLSAVATGAAQNLLHRAAYVTLKERRKLVLVHREMPLTLIDIRNMATVTEAGGILCPANPGFYMLPRTVEDVIDFVVGRVMDLMDIDHTLNVRWEA